VLSERRSNRLEGKIAFISGTGRGQGRVAAQMFAAHGACVVGCDLDDESAAETATLVERDGGRMWSFAPVDLSDANAAASWIAQGVEAAGGVDVVYNNAGAVRFGSVAEATPTDWNFTLRNELDLVFMVTRAAWPHMVARGGGSIINIASGSALRGTMYGGAVSHAAAKGGIISLSRQLAAEGARHGIRSNSICPGVIDTPETAALRARATAGRMPFVPLGRLGRPEDVVYCAIYLASDEASFVTGANFNIDGGVTAVRPTAGTYE
jgi:meso-butanediol dehydrogenase/(S,S)-butanediol dehydrogenase/diacetyl reductase